MINNFGDQHMELAQYVGRVRIKMPPTVAAVHGKHGPSAMALLTHAF